VNTSRIFPLPLPGDAVKVRSSSVQGAFKHAVENLVRRCAADTVDPRERYLSQSVGHEDLENRMREWEAYEARSRCLPPAL
jgi:hypothetical protein